MKNDKVKIAAIVIAVTLFLFVGADFFTGKAITVDGTIQTTDMHISTSYSDDDDSFGRTSRTSVSYSALVSTNENMGMPITVSISNGQYKTLKYGDEVRVEISKGGITGMTHYTKMR